MTAGQLRTPREYSLQLRQHHAARFAPTAQDVLKVGPVYSRLLGKPAKTELAKKAEEGNDQVVPEIQEILAANPDLAWRLMNIGKTAERLLINRMTQVGRPSRTTKGSPTADDVSGSLPGACCAAQGADTRWRQITSRPAKQATTDAAEDIAWEYSLARRVRIFGR
jgi:hypothetical protein